MEPPDVTISVGRRLREQAGATTAGEDASHRQLLRHQVRSQSNGHGIVSPAASAQGVCVSRALPHRGMNVYLFIIMETLTHPQAMYY